MTKREALRLVEKSLQMNANALTGGEALREIANWDSLSTLRFICIVDRELGLSLRGDQVARCRTVSELLGLLGVAPEAKAA